MSKGLLVAALAIIFAAYYLPSLLAAEALTMGAPWKVILGPAVFAAIVTYGVYRMMVRTN